MEFTIDYQNGIREKEECADLEHAKNIADKRAGYTQQNIHIENEYGDIVARRTWYGCTTGIEEQTDPIKYGDFGFYGDWTEY